MKHETASRKFGQQAVAPAPQTAGEIMTTDVISVSIGASVRDVAILLLEKRISAVPVLAADQQLVGMVSEGDLLGRGADDRLARRDWWLTLLKGGAATRRTSPPTSNWSEWSARAICWVDCCQTCEASR